MKHGKIVLFMLCMGCLPVAAEYRTLVGNDGKSIKAELVSHARGKVTIRREDGQEFEIDPAIFCKQDQEAILAWMATKPAAIKYDFEISVNKKVRNRETHGEGSSETNWVHEISIRNDSQDTVKGIHVLYRVLHESWGQTHMLEGDYRLEQDLEFNRTLVITSDPVSIWRSRDSRNGIKGCLVRITDSEGKVIADWVSKDVGMKNVTWDSTSPKDHCEEPPDRAVIQ